MIVGEISSVEIELGLSLLLCYCGIYGSEGMQQTLEERFGLSAESSFGVIS